MKDLPRRSSVEVIADILRINGSKTAIMYGANLSHAQTQKYLNMLIQHGLLAQTESGDRRVYRTTERGRRLLHLIQTIESFVDPSNGRPGTNVMESVQALVRNRNGRLGHPF